MVVATAGVDQQRVISEVADAIVRRRSAAKIPWGAIAAPIIGRVVDDDAVVQGAEVRPANGPHRAD